MKCNLVLDPLNQGWIIEKMANRLKEELPQFGWEVTLGDTVRRDAIVNHFMMYHHVKGQRATPATMLITHVDDSEKIGLVVENLRAVDVGICLCAETVEHLVRQGVREQQLCFIVPACDHLVQPRRIVVGITTHLYWDGRKREDLLVRLAREMSLSSFQFDIFGKDWERVNPLLEASGAKVDYFPGTADYVGDYAMMRDRIPFFDYYLYMGLDDGSLGTLDALTAGVKTIVPPQGFHLHLPGGITHPFINYAELKRIFLQILEERQQRVNSVAGLSWTEYARRHTVVWNALLAGKIAEIPQLLDQTMRTRTQGRGAVWKRIRQSSEHGWNSWSRYHYPRLRHRVGFRTRLKAIARFLHLK